MKLSIIIPVKNGEATLAQCLDRIVGLQIPHEIIVVNDHSTDSSLQLLETRPVKIINLTDKTGAAAARNAGADAAKDEILLFIDADVYTSVADIEKSWQEFMDNGYDCAVASYGPNPALSLVGRYYNLYMMYKYHGKSFTNIFFTSFAMVRKSFLMPFSGKFRFIEDAEMGQRLVNQGRTIHLFKSITVLHNKELTLAALARQFVNRSRESAMLAWIFRGRKSARRDDTVNIPMRISLVLLPLALAAPLVSAWAWFLLIALILVNSAYFAYLWKREGGAAFLMIWIYFYTILSADLGIALGFWKVLRHDCVGTIEIRKTSVF